MKKTIALLLSLCLLLVVALASCGQAPSGTPSSSGGNMSSGTGDESVPEDSAPVEEGGLIGFCLTTLTEEMWRGFSEDVTTYYAELGVEVQSVSCDYDITTQIEQMENFAAMGAKQIIVVPIDSEGLKDVAANISAQGTQIMYIGANPTNYTVDLCKVCDHEAVGSAVAEMAIAWLDQQYPDAEDGSVHVAVLVNDSIEDLKKRGDAMINTISADPRVSVTFTKDGITELEQGSQAIEEALASDPDIKLVLTISEANGIGANQVLVARNGVDLSEYAVFSAGTSEATEQLIDQSAENDNSCYRGVIAYGAPDMGKDIFEDSLSILEGSVETPFVHTDALYTYNAIGYEIAE